MPEIKLSDVRLPDVKLPDVKLPDGLRDMNKDDIVEVVREVKLPKDVKVPKTIKLPDVDLSKVELPDAVRDRLPDSIADRMPNRRGPNPILALMALTVVGLVFVGAWWLMTSPSAGTRVRRAVDDLRSRMNGEENGLIRYDDETHLGSLVSEQTPIASDSYRIGDMGGMPADAGFPVESGASV
jgi:hypothetical protein